MSKTVVAGIVILIAPLAIALIIYPSLPASIPLHFSITGQVNRYGSKNFIFLIGILPFIIYVSILSKYRSHKS